MQTAAADAELICISLNFWRLLRYEKEGVNSVTKVALSSSMPTIEISNVRQIGDEGEKKRREQKWKPQ